MYGILMCEQFVGGGEGRGLAHIKEQRLLSRLSAIMLYTTSIQEKGQPKHD